MLGIVTTLAPAPAVWEKNKLGAKWCRILFIIINGSIDYSKRLVAFIFGAAE